MMKQVKVGLSHFALVDDEDYDDIIKYVWQIQRNKRSNTLYAKRVWFLDSWHVEYMHKRITSFNQTDHINGNGLDNRKSNLRKSTSSENGANRVKQKGNTSSQYKGVSWNKNIGKWQSYIYHQGSRKHLGYFTKEIDAAATYNRAAVVLFGEFATLNPEG